MNKKLFLLLLSLLSASPFLAQVQKGVVKSRGRVDSKGVYIPGKGIPDAFVKVKGANEVASGADGAFQLNILKNGFYLENVTKKGYMLVDGDVLMKHYDYSPNSFVIVLTTPEQRNRDEIMAERRLRSAMQQQLQKRASEIDSLLKMNKLSEEEIQQAS